MAYKLYQFGGVTLPLSIAEDDLSTGTVDASLIDAIGGTFDTFGATAHNPRKQTITHRGMYVGVQELLLDHAGNHILDENGNFILISTADGDLRHKIDALKKLNGTRGSLTRYREDDAITQWKTARLLGVQHTQVVDDVNVSTLRHTFETEMVGWRGTAYRLVTAAYPAQPYFTVHNDGTLTVHDAIFAITAATTITTLTATTTGVDLRYTGTIAAGQSLVINAGEMSVLLAGANAYSGFALGSGHTAADWFPLVVGNSTITVSCDGSGSVDVIWYDQFS